MRQKMKVTQLPTLSILPESDKRVINTDKAVGNGSLLLRSVFYAATRLEDFCVPEVQLLGQE